MRASLRDLGSKELGRFVERAGFEPYRVRQIEQWLNQRGAVGAEEMTNLPAALREKLAEEFEGFSLVEEDRRMSADGTVKFLYRLRDGDTIESVMIPEGSRRTLCVSSQAGCAMGCKFCRTGRDGFRRNLTRGEILEQVVAARRALGGESFSNLVFMGMGEPLENYEAFASATECLASESGMGFSSRRITFSTVGLTDRLEAFGRLGHAAPAVSLNSPTKVTREELMPATRRYPLGELMDACRRYPLPAGERFTFEYVLISGVNDTPDDALRTARLLRGMSAKVNLILFNPFEGSEFRPSPATVAERFREILVANRVDAYQRRSRGADIDAACGQLRAAESAKKTKKK